MTYGELDLKKLREECDLDFAHFTYKKGQCTCCYGPRDLPKLYWREGIIKGEGEETHYILFKNSDFGSGTVTKKDVIKPHTCIAWKMPHEKLEKVCKELKSQLGSEYVVVMPKDKYMCIIILDKGNSHIIDYSLEGHTIIW